MNIKRAKYNSQVGEIFEIKVIDKNIVLFENENPFNGKLENYIRKVLLRKD